MEENISTLLGMIKLFVKEATKEGLVSLLEENKKNSNYSGMMVNSIIEEELRKRRNNEMNKERS